MGHSILLFAATLLTGQVQDLQPVSHRPSASCGCVSGACGANTVGSDCGCGCGSTRAGGLHFFGLFKCRPLAQAGHAGCSSCGNDCDDCASKPSVFTKIRERLQGLFSKGHCGKSCGTCDTCGTCGQAVGGHAVGNLAPMPIHEGLPVGMESKRMPVRPMANEPPLAEPSRGVAIIDQVKPVSFQQQTPAVAPKNGVAILGQYKQRIGHEDDYSWITGQLAQVNGRWVVQYAGPETVDRFGGSLPLHVTQDLKNFQPGDLVNVHGNVLHQAGGQGLIYRVTNIHLVEKVR